MRIAENVVLGLDLGNGSIGWALIEEIPSSEDPEIFERRILRKTLPTGEVELALGSRVIDVPENPKTKELLNVVRRQKRSVRRVIARRAQRMRAIRRLFVEAGVPGVQDVDAVHHAKGQPQVSPWLLRARGLTEPLSPLEFAVALLHIAKHRGFRSNSKAEGQDDEQGKIKTAMQALRLELDESGAETVGAYMASLDGGVRNRKDCNGDSQYAHTMQRAWQEDEVRLLFERQRFFGNALADAGLEARYASLAFDQRELKSVSSMVGRCVFCEDDRRAPAFAPTAELFRFHQSLAGMRIVRNGDASPLSVEELERAAALFGKTASISYKALRKAVRLPDDALFEGVPYGASDGKDARSAESADIVRRSGKACAGTFALGKCLGDETFRRLQDEIVDDGSECGGWPLLDRIAKVLSDNDGFAGMEKELRGLPLGDDVRNSLLDAARDGVFSAFKGTMNLGIRAMRAILPYMQQGERYDQACASAGFDHAKERAVDIDDIRNPVVQHLLREVKRQVKAICHEFDLWPGRVHIELLREVGKSARKRAEIDAGIMKRTAVRKRMADRLEELWQRPPSGMELKRYELWLEQNECCAYAQLVGLGSKVYHGEASSGHIPLDWLKDGSNYVQIDHILPRSRTFDNSFANQCLCVAGANQGKGSRSPYEWIGNGDPDAWHRFAVWVNGLAIKPRKKRAFLLQDLSGEVEGRFHSRSLTDSSYVARLVAAWFRSEYARLFREADDDGRARKRVLTRSGSVTDYLRHVWGVQNLKKNEKGEREGDRHHALDAVIVACCTEGMLQQVTKAFKRNEFERVNDRLPRPWEDFRSSLESAVESVAVSRQERMKTTGALHEETLRSIVQEGTSEQPKTVLYERRWIGGLKPGDVENIKDPGRCPRLVEALRTWLAQDKKSRGPLLHPDTGRPVRHVRIRRGEFTSGVRLGRGDGVAQADNGDMSRVDVYTRSGKYYLVPVYVKDVADGRLPLRACKGGVIEDLWPCIDESYEFLFSLCRDSYVLTAKRDGTIREGYFSGMDRSTAAIHLSLAEDKQKIIRGIGVLTLARLEKYAVDRLGRRHRVPRERDPRTA